MNTEVRSFHPTDQVNITQGGRSRWLPLRLIVEAISARALTSHTHTIANVTNLQTTLDGKSATGHTHTITNVTGLQTALDAKQATITPGAAVSNLSTSLTLTLLTDAKTELEATNARINSLLSSLRTAGVIST